MSKTLLSNLSAIAQNTRSNNIQMIDIADLHDSPLNFFRMEGVDTFADIILAQGGVKENLIVTPRKEGGYEIISGHRRSSAIRLLIKRGENISHLVPCLVQIYPNEQAKLMDLICENIGTRQLDDQEYWRSYEIACAELTERKASGEKFGKVRAMLAKKLNISQSQVSKLQHIANSAAPEIQCAIADGKLSIYTANEIAKLDIEQQKELAQGDLSTLTPKQIHETVARKKKTRSESKSTHYQLTDDKDNGDTRVTIVEDANGQQHSEKDDTRVTSPSTGNDLQSGMMQQEEPNNLNNTGCINQIVLGYFTLALREMGMDQKAIRKAQKLMNGLLDSTDAETAQKAYPKSKKSFL